MDTNKKYEPIKEHRSWYFVEYYLPVSDFKFASLHLVITEDINKTDIVGAMERELKNWLNRYPIPLMVSAFDSKGDLYDLSEIKTYNHLMGFFDQDNKVSMHWRLLKDKEIPNIALNKEYVDNLYANLVFKTYDELNTER